MKKIIYTLSLILLISGCASENKENRKSKESKESKESIDNKEDTGYKISGHWYSCARNGGYIEVHFKKDKFKYSSNFGKSTDWNSFKVSGDTLIQYRQHTPESPIVINQAKFDLSNGNELKIDYFISEESWILNRIHDFKGNIENNTILNQETTERGKSQKCVDYRTREEKHRDSLDKNV